MYGDREAVSLPDVSERLCSTCVHQWIIEKTTTFLADFFSALIKCPEKKQCKGGRIYFNLWYTGYSALWWWGGGEEQQEHKAAGHIALAHKHKVTLQPQSGSQE